MRAGAFRKGKAATRSSLWGRDPRARLRSAKLCSPSWIIATKPKARLSSSKALARLLRRWVARIASDCRLDPSALTVIYAPTQSLAGGVQVVARVLEVALHKAHTLRFPLERIVDGFGAAPLSPPHPDFMEAMGRTNDAIIYGGRVHLFVTGPSEEAKALAEALPSRASRDYGAPFRDIFKRFKGDFYAIDPLLFSPADAIVTSLESGKTFRAGGVDPALIEASFS